MKFRTDFVTNSSSSNFSVAVTISTDYADVSFSEDPSWSGRDGSAGFDGDLRDVNAHLASVIELACWLVDSVVPDTWNKKKRSARFADKQRAFVEEACRRIKSTRDIKTITVERKYDAWGEFAELLGCFYTREYVQKALTGSGIERERALAALADYVFTADDERGDFFGCDSVRATLLWNGESLADAEALAKKINGNSSDRVTGTEIRRLNLETGEYFDESDFDF